MKLRVVFPNGSQSEIDGGGEPGVGACLVLSDGVWVVTGSESTEESRGSGLEWVVHVTVEVAEPVRRRWKPMPGEESHFVYEYSDGTGHHRARVYSDAEGRHRITGVKETFDSEQLAKNAAERICDQEDATRQD